PPETLVATAKYPDQKRWALELGATAVTEPGQLERAVRAFTRSLQMGAQLTGGFDTVVDCVGSDASIAQALRVVAPGGTVVLVGMPARVSLDLTGLWHRETAIRGAYAYTADDFRAAFDLVAAKSLGRLVSATYTLDRFTDAIAHAAEAGPRGSVKVAFDLRQERR
ncbi:MAG: zinc-binding dehydrogenase, partial [Acidimicrobiales bacterium]